MSQVTNYDIPASPLTMSTLATTLQNISAAIASANRGATAPSNPFEGMFWWDSAANPEILKRYTAAGGWASMIAVNITSGAVTMPIYDADLATFALPANTTISAYGKTLVDDTDAATARATLGVDVMPPGIILPYGGSSAPTGWLLCNGQAVSQATYAALYAVIGVTFGNPGSGNFNVPDFRGRFPLGADNMGGSSANRVTATAADTVGSASGNETKDVSHSHAAGTLTGPNHSHSLPIGPRVGGGESFLGYNTNQASGSFTNAYVYNIAGGNSDGVNSYNSLTSYNDGDDAVTGSSASAGSSTQDVMSPYQTVNYIIKT